MYVEKKSVKGARIGAAVIDYIIIYIADIFINLVLFLLTLFLFSENMINTQYNSDGSYSTFTPLPTTNPIFLTVSAAIALTIYFLYYTIIPYFTKGQTIGKMLVRIKVVSIDYTRPTFFQLLIRNIFLIEQFIMQSITITIAWITYPAQDISSILITLALGLVSWIIYIVILIMILTTSDERGFHDMIARTYVVDKYFDLEQLNRVNILERQEMAWAEFDDEEEMEEIEYLKEDEVELLINEEDKIELLSDDDDDQGVKH